MAEETKKVLMVDDEPDITYIIEFLLSHGGFGVKILNDSSKAVAELLSDDYQLLILDLMMPKMDGFTVLEKLRKEGKLEKLPVLILSSRHLTNEETDMLKRLKTQVMAKPFEPHRLLDKVREMVTE
jgi:two-component system phosphate regulon response regulator PhoB